MSSNGQPTYRACSMSADVYQFFTNALQLQWQPPVARRKMNPCGMVARALMCQCLPERECRFYEFDDVLGIGLTGFVFKASYKGREPRAVKMVLLHRGVERKLQVGEDTIQSISELAFRWEARMHRKVFNASPWQQFQVLPLFGKAGVVRVPGRADYKLGVCVMGLLPVPTRSTSELIAMPGALSRIPKLLWELHQAGYTSTMTCTPATSPSIPSAT